MDSLQTIKKEVFKKRPVLQEIQKKFGGLKLRNYVKDAWEVPTKTPDAVFLNIVSFYAQSLFGQNIGEQVKSQLQKKPLVSTVSHLGIWGHPIFVNAELIYSLHFQPNELAVSLATESVSLNNTSSWSGSVLVHSDSVLKRYSFFPDKLKTLPVFSALAINEDCINSFKKYYPEGFEKVLNALKIDVNQKSFTSQACQTSYNLWQAVFPSAPKLIYLPLESIVNEYLLKIVDDNNIINQIIFTKKGQELWQKYFGQEHTFMFWSVDEKGRRKQLTKLSSRNEIYSLLEQRKLYPSSPLCFMVLLLTGFTCAGGFTQTTWLTEVKQKFINLLGDLNALSDASLSVTAVPTKNFAESSLASLVINNEELQPTALDLLFSGKDYYPEFLKRAQEITLAESLDLAMPTIYKVVMPSTSVKGHP